MLGLSVNILTTIFAQNVKLNKRYSNESKNNLPLYPDDICSGTGK